MFAIDHDLWWARADAIEKPIDHEIPDEVARAYGLWMLRGTVE